VEKYALIKANGWEILEKPKIEGELTIGKFLEIAHEKLVGEQIVKPITFKNNSDRLLKIAKGITGIPTYSGKDFDRERSTAAKVKTLNLPLSIFTKETIERYKVAYLAEHSDASNGGATTFNSDLRSAASLFKAKVIESIEIENPFTSVEKVKIKSNVLRYKSKFDLSALIAEAEKTAKTDKTFQPAYELLLFAAGTGCRREEIDRAKWSDIDLENRKFDISGDHLKTDDSAQKVTIVKSVAEKLKAIRATNPMAKFVIKGRDDVSTVTDRKAYRSNVTMKRLTKWLRAYRENDSLPFADVNKPLHTIRKEVGSMLYKQTGDINAAKAYLRHTQISTTLAYYVDDSNQEAPTIDL
ncbi:MAG: site-specific integrase, partial [Verrucomicrobiales bacterium]|nr:site-specific integrase [Verrucomicrobiales bacterium]